MRYINRFFSVSQVCTLILVIVPSECGLCQLSQDKLAITIRDNALSTADFAQKLNVAATGEAKALLASLYFANQSTTKLNEIIIDKSTPAAVRWLAAWEKLKRHAQCQMLRDKSAKTRFESDDISEFFRDIERESKIPKGWRDLLSTGDYLESGWFVPFARSEVPKPKFDAIKLTRDKSYMLLEFEEHSWRIVADKLNDLSFMGAKKADATVFLFFEDEQEAWAYYCAKVDRNRLHWLTKIQSYWVLPEGGNFYVEPTIEGDMLLVYCALPTSVAINHIDVRTGQLKATFSSRWANLSCVDLDNKEVGTNPATPPKNE